MPIGRDPRSVLEDEGVRLHNWSVGDQKTRCPKCSPYRKNKADTSLSVTIFADGRIAYRCHNDGCEWSGWASPDDGNRSGGGNYKRKPPPPPPPPLDPPNIRLKPLGRDALGFFRRRGIPAETLTAFGIGQFRKWMPQVRAEMETIVFPYILNGKLVNRKYRAISDKHFSQDKRARKCLYNGDAARDAAEVVIVEGEMDVLALHAAGFPSAVSLPDGASSKGNAKRLEVLKNSGLLAGDRRFLIAGDADETGKAMRDALIKFIGRGKCAEVSWPTAFGVVCKDAGDALQTHGPETVAACVRAARPCHGRARPGRGSR